MGLVGYAEDIEDRQVSMAHDHGFESARGDRRSMESRTRRQARADTGEALTKGMMFLGAVASWPKADGITNRSVYRERKPASASLHLW